MKSQKIISLNPSLDYAVNGEIDSSTRDEIDAQLLRARHAFIQWSGFSVAERIVFLERLFHLFVKRRNEIRSLIVQEIGIPVSVCDQIDIDPGLQYMRGYLDCAQKWLEPEVTYETDDEIHTLFFEPKGLVGASVPWNYPFSIFIWAVIQNLVVGNTIIVKHSEECPLTAKLLEEIIHSADLPQGVFTMIYGDGIVGDYLMRQNIDLIWFTGSTGVGKHLYQVAAQKFIPAILELGGSAVGIVFEDVDIKMTIESIYSNRFINSGQTCDGLKRLLVHHSLFDELLQKLTDLVRTKKIGPAQDPSTDIGPLVAQRQVDYLEKQVADAVQKGARIIMGGERPSLKGAYYQPTIITDVTFDMKIWKEEVFGPVLPIVPFGSEEEAIRLANDSCYGLGGYVYTQNKERALRVSKHLQTGNICVNGANYNVIAEDPFGGYKDSGIGREHGRHGLRELCLTKLIALKK